VDFRKGDAVVVPASTKMFSRGTQGSVEFLVSGTRAGFARAGDAVRGWVGFIGFPCEEAQGISIPSFCWGAAHGSGR